MSKKELKMVENSNNVSDALIELVHTFSKEVQVINGEEFDCETGVSDFDSAIKKSLMVSRSKPIVILNAHNLNPQAAKILYKYCDGEESLCPNSFFIFFIRKKIKSHDNSTVEICEQQSREIYSGKWSEHLPDYILLPLIHRISEFTVCF
ncbi:hypothetical protein RF11_06221 [Thelohanellus kitauei]|uniref:Uncharacterized protein n=1 Tax=Thelohanellus kitauei TaxID=669202 RepID=A0A0C2M9M5_THEKT|nr:hypothetical protein RF11_06221 [Thelohanellus kitauei]